MANGNGAIPFRPPVGIPLVGQAFVFHSAILTAMITCQCAAKVPLLLVGKGPGMCPACRRAFQVQGFEFNPQTGKFNIQIGVGASAPPPVGEQAGVAS